MVQARRQTVIEKDVIKEYVRLKNLIRSKQRAEAIRLFESRGMIKHWRELLHYAMTRRNCPVSSVMIDMVYKLGDMPKEVFRVEVSKLFHDVRYDFAQQVTKYLDSVKFDKEMAKFKKVGLTVDSRVRACTGDPLVDLKSKHFDNSYLLKSNDEAAEDKEL